jgi:L-lactate dehydrogenase (cytochrome)
MRRPKHKEVTHKIAGDPLSDIRSLRDFEPRARHRLPRSVFCYVGTGIEDDRAYRRNLESFDCWAFRPRVLAGALVPDLTTTIFGYTYAAPFGIAPMGGAALGCFRGDQVLAAGAAAEGLPMLLSGASSTPMEAIPPLGGAPWFQAYMPTDRTTAAALVRRVWAAGFKVLVVTVDVPVMSNRSHYERLGFSLPLRPSLRLAFDGIRHPRWLLDVLMRTLLSDGLPHYENLGPERGGPLMGGSPVSRQRAQLGWDDVAAVRALWPGHLVLKGLLHPADAERARQEGIDGIIVSNHGGRQLDSATTALEALPGMVAAAPDIPMMMDGGIRRGSDILKAMALGVRLIFVGRPFYYAMALARTNGVRHAARLLKDELHRDLAMLGCQKATGLDPDLLVRICQERAQ